MGFSEMRILLTLLASTVHGENTWTKCTRPCDGGEQSLTSDLEVKRTCNIESCQTYDELNMLADGRMNDPTKWGMSGTGQLEQDSNSYDQNGFLVSGRRDEYHSIHQDVSCALWAAQNHETVFSKVYIKFDVAHDDIEITPKIRASGVNSDYRHWISFTKITVPKETEHFEWFAIEAKAQLKFKDDPDLTDLMCRYQLQVTNPVIDFHIDHVYLFSELLLTTVFPGQFNINGDFEMQPDSVFTEYDGWEALDSTGELILSKDSPQGHQYLEVANRKSDRILQQRLFMPDNFDYDTLIEVRFWGKFRYAAEMRWTPEGSEKLQNRFYTKFNVDYTVDGKKERFGFRCQRGCSVADNTWRQYHCTANILRESWDSDLIDHFDTIDEVYLELFGIEDINVNVAVDDFQVGYYQRNRDWVAGADLRILELRTERVNLKVHGEKPRGSKLEVKMTKNRYPFGGKFNTELLNKSWEEWKFYFNYGYCVSEMKWYITEKEKGVRDFTKGDRISNKFQEANIPLGGSSLLWEVYGRGVPEWYIEEFEAYINAGESSEPLSKNILDMVESTVNHYLGKNTNYKMYNEPLHDNHWRGNYNDLWNRTINAARSVDPDIVLGVNDYDIVKSDMAVCTMDLVEPYVFDFLGLQSHMLPGFNGEIVNERLDILASQGHELYITEFDSIHYNISERAKDTEDFMRLAFSHPAVEQIIAWYFVTLNVTYSIDEFRDQRLFEAELNENSTDFVDQGYPWYPNEAGMAWIKLVKEAWTGDELIELDGQLTMEQFERNLYNGEYQFGLITPDGERTAYDTIITNENCRLYTHNKVAGEFDDKKLDNAWIITYADWALTWDGYMYDGLLITKRQGSNRDIQLELIGAKLDLAKAYRVQLYAKLLDEFLPNSQTITVTDQSMQTVASGVVLKKNQWIMVESTFELTGLNTVGVLTVKTGDYTGDLIIDHVLVTESFYFDQCERTINLTF